CFCDIPLSDLGLHMQKYSRFGISFRKSVLLKKGANPVFYMANDSIVRDQLPSVRNSEWHAQPAAEYSRQHYLDRLIGVLHARRHQLFSRLAQSCQVADDHRLRLHDEDFQLLIELEILLRAVDKHFLSFCVPFNAQNPDAHPENYYFE